MGTFSGVADFSQFLQQPFPKLRELLYLLSILRLLLLSLLDPLLNLSVSPVPSLELFHEISVFLL